MTEPVRRIITGDTVGPVDATAVPRYGGAATFARLPRHRRGAHRPTSPSSASRSTRGLLPTRRPVRSGPHPGLVQAAAARTTRRWTSSRSPCQQVADAGDIAVNPFDIDEAIATDRASAPTTLRDGGTKLLTLGGDHTIALPLLRALHRDHGPIAVLHFDAHLDTWDTYFGAAYTHGTPFRRASEEGLLDPEQLPARRHPRAAVRRRPTWPTTAAGLPGARLRRRAS